MHGGVLTSLYLIAGNGVHLQEILNNALGIIEIDHGTVIAPAYRIAMACHEAGNLYYLTRQLSKRQCLWIEYRSHIKDLDILVLPGQVPNSIFKYAAQQGGTYQRELVCQRIHDRNCLSQTAVLWQLHLVKNARVGKAEGYLLRKSHVAQHQLNPVLKHLLRALAPLGYLTPWSGGNDIVKAVDTGDFLRKILHKGYVVAPGWNFHTVHAVALISYLEIELFQDVNHLLCWQLCSQAVVDLLSSKLYMNRLLGYRIYIYYTLGHSAGTHVLQQLGCSIERTNCGCNICATLKAAGSFRM